MGPFFTHRFILSCLALSLILTGCNRNYSKSLSNDLQTQNIGVPLPQYRAGDMFIYSNGTWEKIKSINAGEITWENNRGYRSQGNADFTYRRNQWESSKRYGSRTYKPAQFLLSEPTESLWPLIEGKPNRFIEYGKWYPKPYGIGGKYDVYWRCQVIGENTFNVAAGDFDGWVISCDKYRSFKSYPGSKSSEDVVWYYAPAAGHWVKEIKKYSSSRPMRAKELVAVVPDLNRFTKSKEEAFEIKKLFQNTLEYNSSSKSGQWINKFKTKSVVITPVKSLRHKSGAICRQYTQQMMRYAQTSSYYGIACKDKEGRWKIPRR